MEDDNKSSDNQYKYFSTPPSSKIGNIVLLLLWHLLHLIMSLWYWVKGIADAVESYAIASQIHSRCTSLNLHNLHNLAIAIDNEEAHCTSKVIKLLHWLAAIGVKNVHLYDDEGVLKKSREAILETFYMDKSDEETVKNIQRLEKVRLNMNFLSSTDGKEAVVKAANHLFAKHYLDTNERELVFTESDVSKALEAVGVGGPDPELLLVYGPARCHLGFPVWRIRYTEIVHMGSLKSLKCGSLIKAIHKFSMVRQNFGK